jgi:hypothetical protein
LVVVGFGGELRLEIAGDTDSTGDLYLDSLMF